MTIYFFIIITILDLYKQCFIADANMTSFSAYQSLSAAQKQQAEEELKGFAAKVEDMDLAKLKAIEHLYNTADYLDKV